jgi:hypothetical protein
MLLRIAALTLLLAQTPPAESPSDFVQSVIKALPTWEEDALAQYEQTELTAVRRDLDEIAIEGADDKQLTIDWDALEALDKMLHHRLVI